MHREQWSCSVWYSSLFSPLCVRLPTSLASVNGHLQTNYNNSVIFPHILENDCSAVCASTEQKIVWNKTKIVRSIGAYVAYSTVKIKYRLLIVKSTKLHKAGILTKATFVCIYPFRRLARVRDAAVCAHAVHIEHSARVVNGVVFRTRMLFNR